MLLLQADPASILPVGQESKESILDLIIAGGWTMIPIGILFVIAIFVFIERFLTIRRSDKDPTNFMQTVRSYVVSGNLEQAKTYCVQENTPFARMVLKGLSRLGNPLPDIAAAIDNVGNLEVYRLEKRISVLAMAAGMGPMLGFFGTVIGMIEGFMRISHLEGNVSPSDLASGIYVAMVTTAAGLVVGIFAFVAYNQLVGMVGNVVYRMQITSTDFIDLLQEPAK